MSHCVAILRIPRVLRILSGALLLLALAHQPGFALGPEGVWVRESKTLDGAPVTTATATLIVGPAVFNHVDMDPNDNCAFSGPMVLTPTTMTVEITFGSCPSEYPIGQTLVYSYTLANEKLTTTRNTELGLLVEEYSRSPIQSEEEMCSHPLCGTWLRVETWAGGEFMHAEPSIAIFTDTDYWAVAAMCFNELSVDSVVGNVLTMTMLVHNCPVGPGYPMQPGFVVIQTFELTEDGNRLKITNSQFGMPVDTIFIRLEDAP